MLYTKLTQAKFQKWVVGYYNLITPQHELVSLMY